MQLNTSTTTFRGDYSWIKDEEQYRCIVFPHSAHMLCVNVCVCVQLTVEAPISKSHLIIHAPQHGRLVFIKCQYVARTENELGIVLPLHTPNH